MSKTRSTTLLLAGIALGAAGFRYAPSVADYALSVYDRFNAPAVPQHSMPLPKRVAPKLIVPPTPESAYTPPQLDIGKLAAYLAGTQNRMKALSDEHPELVENYITPVLSDIDTILHQPGDVEDQVDQLHADVERLDDVLGNDWI